MRTHVFPFFMSNVVLYCWCWSRNGKLWRGIRLMNNSHLFCPIDLSISTITFWNLTLSSHTSKRTFLLVLQLFNRLKQKNWYSTIGLMNISISILTINSLKINRSIQNWMKNIWIYFQSNSWFGIFLKKS